ncbi:MAG: type IV toxin-antitoxin system AbiEi family antitoxin domain-containing protein, partial [Nitrospirales bacterium]
VPTAWLRDQGISPQLVRKYVKSGWLLSLAHGAYARPTTPVNWQGIVLGLQKFLKFPLHIGGISAMNLQGFAHFLPLGGESRIHAWSHSQAPVRLPSWVEAVKHPQTVIFHGQHLFDPAMRNEGLTTIGTQVRDWTLTVAMPERAIMEVLSLVDETPASFMHAVELFEGLSVLRPSLVQQLLEGCTSIKVKRIFLFLVKRQDYPWTRKLQTSRITLGRGKRLVTRGGRLDRTFFITVPEDLIAHTG